MAPFVVSLITDIRAMPLDHTWLAQLLGLLACIGKEVLQMRGPWSLPGLCPLQPLRPVGHLLRVGAVVSKCRQRHQQQTAQEGNH